MSDCFCRIDIHDIDLTDERYRLSLLKEDSGFLAQSIKQTGLITPPLVRRLNQKYIIISGFKRVQALRHQHESKIFVCITDPETTDCQCLIKSIAAVAFQRPLTQAELIITTERLHHFLDKKKIAALSPAVFNRALNVSFIEDLVSIAKLPDPALDLILQGSLSLKAAKRLVSFEKETVKNFLTVFSKIKVSSSKQLEIIQYIMEISARDGLEPQKFFTDSKFCNILDDGKKDPVFKTNILREYLFERRFPSIFKTRQRVQKKIKTIKLGKAIKFLPPHNFESQNYCISFTAKNYSELKENIQTLNKALENEALKEIFNP